MKIGMLTLIFFSLALYEVQAKAVERSNHMFNAGPYRSFDHFSSQLASISEQDVGKSLEGYKTLSTIGKPLYFGQGSTYKSKPSTSENYEYPSTDRLELSNYENIEGMFDTLLEFPTEHKFAEPKSKIDPSYSLYEEERKKLHKNGDILKEDQVFLHKNTGKRVKQKQSDEQDGIKSLHFKSGNKKSSDAGSPCSNADKNDYHNKSSIEHSSAGDFNLHGVENNNFKQKSQSSIYLPPSKDQQFGTKIIHEDINLVRTEPRATLDSNPFKENFSENIEKKPEKLSTDRTDDSDSEVPELEVPSSNKRVKTASTKTVSHQDVETQTLSLSKHEEDKHFEANHIFDSSLRSFVFNPNAEPQEVFQECKTPRNESGFCRYIQHCMLPSILGSIRHFMDNVCIIKEQFIGVCCPEFPVQSVLVTWPDRQSEFGDVNDTVEVPEDCGVGTNKRIIGGVNADRKAWPWMVALLNSDKKFFCGGSLINNRYVLTAAHCTFGPSKNRVIARLGEYDFNDPREPHDDYLVVEIKRHGQYARFTLRNDIAVLKLERPVVFNEFVRTICLPDPDKDYMGKLVTLAGWGHLNGASSSTRSDVLQEASFPIIRNDECSKTHGVPIASSIICAASPGKDKGACNGDSGGPLMLLDSDERWKVVGVVSWGRRGCNPKFPTAYSKVTHYLDWIKEHTT